MGHDNAGTDTVALPATLGIEESAPLKALLAPHADRADAVTLHAADVARLHTATLQLLCAFVRTRTQAGRVTRWQAPSEPLRQAAAALALEPLLGLSASP